MMTNTFLFYIGQQFFPKSMGVLRLLSWESPASWAIINQDGGDEIQLNVPKWY